MEYKYLGPRRGSLYRQYFVNGRGIFAQTLWLDTRGEDARTPEAVAYNYDVPVEAVREAIEYCEHNQALLQQEADEDYADMLAKGYIRNPVSINGSQHA